MEEIWKDIKGYEGKYQVSNLGRIKVLNYKRSGQEHIMATKNNKGYCEIRLAKDGKRKDFIVHRLVAQAFIPNPNNLPQVNHIDENKTNNCVNNLEWCTQAYNNSYGTRLERVSATLKNKYMAAE